MSDFIPNLRLSAQKADIYSKVDGLSIQNLFYVYFETFPNCYMFTRLADRGEKYIFDTKKMYDYFKNETPAEEEVEMIRYITRDMSNDNTFVGFCVLLKKSHIFARFETDPSESYVLFDNEHEDDLNKFIDLATKYYKVEKPKKNNFFTISSSQRGFNLVENSVREIKDFSIDKQYNDDFKPQDKKIQEFIASDDAGGLIILHGTKGTGKTTYIRHLISTNPSKKFVFVPAGLIEMLGMPEFQTFLLSLSKHVIILEDCENALRDRKTNANGSAVSLLLNMSDGLLSDSLGIKFICTFNEDIKDMDEAITRKGRLVSKYDFKALVIDKANALLREVAAQKSGEDVSFIIDDNGGVYQAAIDENGFAEIEKTDKGNDLYEVFPHIEIPYLSKPTTLADIYNYDKESYATERKKII